MPEPVDYVVGQFSGVSCTAPNECTAVGYYYDGTDGSAAKLAFAARWDGTSLTLQSVVNPSATQLDELNGVSCSCATACVAVGSFEGSEADTVTETLVEAWDGTSWTQQNSPNPIGPTNIFRSVSCTATTACVAVGENYDPTNFKTNLAEVWNGVVWTAQTTPTPDQTNFFTGVSCTSATRCTAVGRQANQTTGYDYTYAQTWNGSTWTTRKTRDPGLFVNVLQGVSCVSSTCIAAGGQLGSGGLALTLIEQRG